MKEIKVNADVKNLDVVLGFMHEVIEPYNCSMEVMFQLELALEEAYVNIAHHAYPNDVGSTIIRCDVLEKENDAKLLVIDILDQGIPYNPIEHVDPNIETDAENREIGGLGIYMIKNSMDALSYRYEDEHNIFTVEKYLK